MALDVASDWFVARSQGAGVTQIVEPHAHPLLRANIWHIAGSEHAVFIDAGLGIASLQHTFPHLFERRPSLLLSHAHLDHAGGAYEFNDVRIHRAEAERLRHPHDTSLRADAVCEALGTTSTVLGSRLPPTLLDALPEDGFSVETYRVRSAQPTRLLRESETIDLGTRRIRTVELPGHSPGSLGFLDSESGALFSGDALYDGTLLDNLAHSNVTDYRATMKRILSLEFRLVYPGHGPPLCPARAREICRNYLARTTDMSTPSEDAQL